MPSRHRIELQINQSLFATLWREGKTWLRETWIYLLNWCRWESRLFVQLSWLRTLNQKTLLQFALFLSNLVLFLIAATLAYLWHWAMGLFLIAMILTTLIIAFWVTYLSNRFQRAAQVQSLQILAITEAAIQPLPPTTLHPEALELSQTFKPAETPNPLRFTSPVDQSSGESQVTTADSQRSRCFCCFCGSRHHLLAQHPFHPKLHQVLPSGADCLVPILRSKVERIDLEL